MIQLIYEAPRTAAFSRFWGLRIDDEKIPARDDGIIIKGAEDGAWVAINNRDVSRKAVIQRVSDIDATITTLRLRPQYSRLKQTAAYQDVSLIRDAEALTVSWDIRFYLADWKENFSITEYVEEFLSILKNRGNRSQRQDKFPGSGFSILSQ